MVSFITLSGSLFITLSAKSLLHYRGGCLLHYRLNLLHYREVLHYRLIFITLSGSITLSGVYYIIGCNTRVSKCGQLSQQTRRLDPILFQCWSSAVGGGPILKQHWVKSSRLLGSTQVSVYTHPSPTIIFSPADQGTFSKTDDQSQAYYNT